MHSVVWGFFGGLVAWVVTTFFAQPLRQFLELRGRAADALAKFEEDPRLSAPDADPPADEWLAERKAAYDAIGSALIGFALSQTLMTKLLRWRFLGKRAMYPLSAGRYFRTLADTRPETEASADCRRGVHSGLKIPSWPYHS